MEVDGIVSPNRGLYNSGPMFALKEDHPGECRPGCFGAEVYVCVFSELDEMENMNDTF